MNQKVSSRIASLAVSQTLAMAQKSRELQAQGIDVINLSVGEPDFPTPDHIKEAAKKAIDNNFSYYSPVPGYKDLRDAISAKFKRENNLDFTPEQIVVSCGAKHSIANVLACVVDKDDEVIIPAPFWVSYIEMVKLADGKSVIIDAGIDQDFKVTPQQLEAAITPKTRAFLFSSPSNPTGSLYSREELKALADVFAKHENIIIISDEIYEHINYVGKHESIAQFENLKDRVVVVNGVSKGYAMTGWRIGYIGAPLWISKACEKLQGQVTSGVCSIAQKASVAALNESLAPTLEMKKAFLRRRNLVLEKARQIKGMKANEPGGAFYVFPDISSFFGKSDGSMVINNCDDMSLYLLKEAFVATVAGSAFGDNNCIRFSYATSDEILEKAMDRIKAALEKLK
ncbi:MAG: aspartate aminotransferase [Bacteroidetes bacterium GWF2_38_335]|nr:MAG: aspartate aminotransferase [Bacteroidetes bacterium GWF2_38_335]OFY78502.1 MAG: aspartate aminotransferase [Bacteroidetes bacterium RIFOXYA12_FULL_38_20]HBS88451.1 aspartate aminotransferase [Bacteroidales bacterium]